MAHSHRPARPATAPPADKMRAQNRARKADIVATSLIPQRHIDESKDVRVFGSSLTGHALDVLATLTPDELRALDRYLFSTCFYGKDEGAAMRGAHKLHRAAEAL